MAGALTEGAAEGVAVAIDAANAERVVSELRQANAKCMQVECDISDEDRARDCVDAVHKAFGNVDILLNCAGVGHITNLEELTLEQWNRAIAINLTGTYRMSACWDETMTSAQQQREHRDRPATNPTSRSPFWRTLT